MTLTFPLIEVSGTSRQMGRQHGEQAAPLIQGYLRLIERVTGRERDELCRNAMAFMPRIQALSPEFVEEVMGLAEGAGISFEEAVLCQVRAEAGSPIPGMGEGCTAFALRGAATADGRALVGQNQDLGPEYLDVSILLRLTPSDGRPRALMYTFAGQLGYFGMNEYGVANYANALWGYTRQPGLPQYPQKRMMLEQRTLDGAIDIFRRHASCSAANTITCDGSGAIADLEVRPEGTVLYKGEHPDAIVHTNHYLTDAYRQYEDRRLPDSFQRFERMSELVRQDWGVITVDHLKRFLADHHNEPGSICRHGLREMHTTSGHIAEPEAGLLHIRRGHGCTGVWETFEV